MWILYKVQYYMNFAPCTSNALFHHQITSADDKTDYRDEEQKFYKSETINLLCLFHLLIVFLIFLCFCESTEVI